MTNTTIQIPKTLRMELKKIRKYKRETYKETLERLVRKEKEKMNKEVKK